MKYTTKCKIFSTKSNIIHFDKEKIESSKENDIENLLIFFLRKDRISTAVNLIKDLDESTLYNLKSIIFDYIINKLDSNKDVIFPIITCSVKIFSDDELMFFLNEFYKNDNLKKDDITEKTDVLNLAKERLNKNGNSMTNYFINLISRYHEPEKQVVNYLKLCLKNKFLEKDQVCSVVNLIAVSDDIDTIVDFVKTFNDWLTDDALKIIIVVAMYEENAAKLFCLSTVLVKRHKLLVMVGYEICKIKDAEYIYHFANHYYAILHKDEKEYILKSMSQTQDAFWIAYFASAVDKNILNYYDFTLDTLKGLKKDSSINSTGMEEIDKMIFDYILKSE